MQAPSIFEYILTKDSSFLDNLYGADMEQQASDQALSCKAVFQSLSSLSKNYVMRLLFLGGSNEFKIRDLADWIQNDSMTIHREALRQIIKYQIIRPVASDLSKSTYQMNSYFCESLKYAISSSFNPLGDCIIYDYKELQSKPSKLFIESACHDRWNKVLHNLIAPKESTGSQADQACLSFFHKMKLMQTYKNSLEITSLGYEYLLKSKANQVWLFVYEKLLEYDRNNDTQSAIEIISLLFKLAHCDYGGMYDIKGLSLQQQRLILEFGQLGIIYTGVSKNSKLQYFLPTRISINMIYGESISSDKSGNSSGGSSIDDDAEKAGAMQILCETNFQVVAYVTSRLHLEMLRLFMEVQVRLPDMTLCKITRSKALSAYRKHITASQIIEFLTLHSHPCLRNKQHLVPENVCDQLVLWENEGRRVKDDDVILFDFNQFDPQGLKNFDTIRRYSEEKNACVWFNRDQRLIAIKEELGQKIEDAIMRL